MKKVISFVLCLTLCLAMLTAGGFADEVKQKNSFTMYSCYVEAEVAGLVALFKQCAWRRKRKIPRWP